MATATLCTAETTLRTYCLAIAATSSCRLLPNENWKAIVKTDLKLDVDAAAASCEADEPTSRLEVRSIVLFEFFHVCFESPWMIQPNKKHVG